MCSTMMEEEQQPEEPGQLQLAIGTAFSVDQATAEFVDIKLEPQELISEVIEEHDHSDPFTGEAVHDQLSSGYPEISDVIMQRAVSPPSYPDPSEQRMEELILKLKNKYQLKDVTVKLECCDKIWETIKLIKDVQGFLNEADDPYCSTSPKNSSISSPKLPGPLIPYEPTLGNNNKALPDFRFSVKSKKKLYHCITCGQEFLDGSQLRQHAVDEHGIYFNPKRVYKPRADAVKPIPVVSDDIQKKFIEDTEIEPTVPIVQPIEPTQLVTAPEIKNAEAISNNDSKAEEISGKVNNAKEKIKCVLCKRVCTDIVYHMKGYHKVGCVGSIVAQCEKIVSDNINTIDMEKNSQIPEREEIDLNEPLVVSVKKRKRNAPRWTMQRKKYKFMDTTSNTLGKQPRKGPFKCTVCLGIYKSVKSFAYHRRIHAIRGETAENFDPSKCRFLNSPLRTTKTHYVPEQSLSNYVNVQKPSIKSQTPITDYITIQKDTTNISPTPSEPPIISEDFNIEINNEDKSERTCCDCGRSFRNYHTMYLHKVKCKGINGKNCDKPNADADSGIGISIKLKKNKNDSYEVVPNSTPIEENYKESRSCKDSDSSSNDSGMVSIDDNNHKADSNELAKYSKGHSILRIQVAEDDEEVDIEDGDSDHSNFNENHEIPSITSKLNNTSEAAFSPPLENNNVEQITTRIARSTVRKSNVIPSLTNLCKQVLSKSKEQQEDLSTYKCQTCSMFFKNKTELMEHALKMKHNVKSHCPCGKKFKNLKYFNIHVRRYHPLLLKCSYCMTNFDRIEKYTQHKCEVTEGDVFIEPIIQTECLQCKALVDLGEPFDKHMKMHSADTTTVIYQCFKCDLKFGNSHQRRSHFSKEHGFSPCRICGKLLHIDYLSKHEAYHDGVGHPCHVCKKAFTQKALLKKHLQNTHDPLLNEVVKCIVCSKSMKLRCLKKHMSFHLHSEICKKCNKCDEKTDNKMEVHHPGDDHCNGNDTLMSDIETATFISDPKSGEINQKESCNVDADENGTSVVVQNLSSI